MNRENPYKPVSILPAYRTRSDRPIYIVTTIVVLLLWAGTYINHKSKHKLSVERGYIVLEFQSDPPTERMPRFSSHTIIEISMVGLSSAIFLSIVCTNILIWLSLKMFRYRLPARVEDLE
jgi:hypothetical protein